MNKLLKRFQNAGPWNKGKLMGQKAPLTAREIWSIRMRLQDEGRTRDLALFNLAIDSELRACDLLQLKFADISSGGRINKRASISQQKTGYPVRFEITARTKKSVKEWVKVSQLSSTDYMFPSRINGSPHLSTRQYARIVDTWVAWIGLDPTSYGTHSLRRTKNLSAGQLLLGHTNLDSTARNLGIEIDDALEVSEQTDV